MISDTPHQEGVHLPKRDQAKRWDDQGTADKTPSDQPEPGKDVSLSPGQNGDRATSAACMEGHRQLAIEPSAAGGTLAKEAVNLANGESSASNQDRLSFTERKGSPTESDLSTQCSSTNDDGFELREEELGALKHYSCNHRSSTSRDHDDVTAADGGTTSSVAGSSNDGKKDRPDTEAAWDSETSDEDHEGKLEDYRGEEDERDSNASDEDFDIAFIRQPRSRVKTFGIPLLFKKTDDSPPALSEVCLQCAEQHIAFAAQESPLTVTATRRGYLRVTVETTIAASFLQDMDDLGGIPVKVELPRAYSDNVAKITNVPEVYTDSQIRQFFAASGVVSAKRQCSYRTREDGSIAVVPSGAVLLTFRPEKVIPVRIRPNVENAEAFAYRFFPVRPHVTVPTMCLNCFRFGHMAKHCRRRKRCKVCAGYHNYKECTTRDELRCCNCKGPHAATYSMCPVRMAAVRDKRFALKFDRRPRDGNCY